MEKIFLQKVHKLTDQIVGREIDYDVALLQLEKYLEHAKRLDMQRYLAETLNALGILHTYHNKYKSAQVYYRQAQEQMELPWTYEEGNIEFILKVANNLAVTNLKMWKLDDAKKSLEASIQLVHEHEIDNIAVLYNYSNLIVVHVNLGDFRQAHELFQKAWAFAEDPKLTPSQSRMKFFQIIAQLRHQYAKISIAMSNCQTVLKDLAVIDEQVNKTERDDYLVESQIIRLYHAIICDKNEEKASETEDKLLAMADGLSAHTALEMSNFFKFNGYPSWSQKYAAQVLNYIGESDDPVALAMRQYIDLVINA